MALISLGPLLEHARHHHYAVGAFNFGNAETAQAIIEAGEALRSPVLFIYGPSEVRLYGAQAVVDIASCLAKRATVPVGLHLDHTGDIETIQACIDAGFPSVMIDGSALPFDENVRLTRAVVLLAHERGVTVEGELGAIGRVDDSTVEGGEESTLTDPEQAAEFARLTGVDALACSIGNAHGMYPQKPHLDLARLTRIRELTPTQLVLHGGSGTPTDQLRGAVNIGVTKVNVASEIGRAYLSGINECLERTAGKEWWVHALIEGKQHVRGVVERWMHNLGSAGMLDKGA
ncbi:MAG: class II fructose-bisphosphate aldolase [Capsulimonadaceae bacterium]|nr:class II fructose-bisphosphate aldolase [Capsulimonadaceae bacterium]